MAYLYHAIVYKNPSAVGVGDNNYAADVTDFETNFKSSALLVDTIIVAETTFEIDKTYTTFKALIDGEPLLDWSDVKYTEDNIKYTFNLLTENPL